MEITIELREKDYQYCLDYASDKSNTMALNNIIGIIKAIADGTVLPDKVPSQLDEIRAEIENDWQLKKYPSSPFSCGLRQAIEIIDKYKGESEG